MGSSAQGARRQEYARADEGPPDDRSVLYWQSGEILIVQPLLAGPHLSLIHI